MVGTYGQGLVRAVFLGQELELHIEDIVVAPKGFKVYTDHATWPGKRQKKGGVFEATMTFIDPCGNEGVTQPVEITIPKGGIRKGDYVGFRDDGIDILLCPLTLEEAHERAKHDRVSSHDE
jgi:hypothetical protein